MTKIRLALIIFITFLVLSGVTAFPIRVELEFLMKSKDSFPNYISIWIESVYNAVKQTPDILLYGTDWLAFAHIIIALFFIPVYFNPIKYKGNLIVAMFACGAVFILAFVCGPIRGIPFFHQLIDCSFGLIAFFPLYFVFKKISLLEELPENKKERNPPTKEFNQLQI